LNMEVTFFMDKNCDFFNEKSIYYTILVCCY